LSHEKKNPSILVTASVPEEAEGIKEHLAGMRKYEVGGKPVFEGRIGEALVRLSVTGPGLVNTAQGLTAAIETLRPDMIIMTGCAGGFARAGMKVGDIGVASEENDAHLGIEAGEEGGLPMPLPFDLEVIDGRPVGPRIAMDSRMSREAAAVLKGAFGEQTVNIVRGPFVTVATITATDLGAHRLYERFHPCMENMEGIAGAHVAMHYGIPFVELRCTSNLVGKRNRSAWNLPLACRRSAEAALIWIRSKGGG
jgi:futalosine hydrolase